MVALARNFLLIAFVLIAGCVQSQSPAREGAFSVRLETSSDKVFQNKETTLYVDVQNNMIQDAKNVRVDVFSAGLFERGACIPAYVTPAPTGSEYIPAGDIKQGELQIVTCKLKAKEIVQNEMETTIFAKVSFGSRLQASQIVKLISQNEFEIREKTGKIEKEPGSYTYRDDNIELDVTFSSEMPIVKKDTREFVTFKVKNIGNGFIQKLVLGTNFKFIQNPADATGKKLVDEACLAGTAELLGNEFPAITCELNLPSVNYLSNNVLIINIDYQYEVRESLPVKIIR